MSMSMERLEEALAQEEATNVQLRTRIAELEAQQNIRNATLDEIATKIEQDFKGAFGADTCASWAAWIRNQKCEK